MMTYCVEYQNQIKILLEAYNRMADKEKMRKVFLNGKNNYDEVNSGILLIMQKKYFEKNLNTNIL